MFCVIGKPSEYCFAAVMCSDLNVMKLTDQCGINYISLCVVIFICTCTVSEMVGINVHFVCICLRRVRKITKKNDC